MAHIDQTQFVENQKKLYPQFFKNKRVLDCGSMDINGSVKHLFEECEYLGIDNHPGKNVDWVIPVHHLNTPGYNIGVFDTVISCEMLEHDYYWKRSLKKMYTLLKSEGLLIFTCAGYNRREHGVEEFASDNKKSYYENLTISDITQVFDLELLFSDVTIEYKGSGGELGDLYFSGLKR